MNDTLSLRFKKNNGEGSDLAIDAPVAVISYPLDTIFAQFDITLSGGLIHRLAQIIPIEPLSSLHWPGLSNATAAGS